MRVLSLHGKSQNKEVFRKRLGQLPKKLKKFGVRFEIIEAPHDLPLEEGQSVAMKTWFNRIEFRSVEPESLETTFQLIETEWSRAREEGDPFVGLLGFSQGGTLAAILATQPDRFPGLQFVVCCGAPNNDIVESEKIPRILKTLHCGGDTDTVVPISSSKLLAEKFHEPTFYIHPQGHCIPSRAESQRLIIDFFGSMAMELSASSVTTMIPNSNSGDEKEMVANESVLEAQRDEIEAVQGIYQENVSIHSLPDKVGDETGCFSVVLSSPDIPAILDKQITVRFSMPSHYPEGSESPRITVQGGSLSLRDFPTKMKATLVKKLTATAAEHVAIHSQCAFACIQTAIDWLSDPEASTDENISGPAEVEGAEGVNKASGETDVPTASTNSWYLRGLDPSELTEAEEDEEVQMMELATSRAAAEQAKRLSGRREDASEEDLDANEIADEYGESLGGSRKGLWRYCIGLVGKPSAGKSTLFNCATRAPLRRAGRLEAAMGSQPFTTIDPNVGEGFFLGPPDMGEESMKAAGAGYKYGFGAADDAATNRRLLPVIIKDVAGLVPGAYKGRGKGNKFLNDLTDADCLVHVVDTSGLSDEGGNLHQPHGNDADSDGYDTEASRSGGSGGGGGGDKDARWIRQEIHRWIFHNVKAKWHSVVRQARAKNSNNTSRGGVRGRDLTRVLSLFTGYHSTPSIVRASLHDAKLDCDKVIDFTAQDVHCLVACFLQRRFPICLALNKIDLVATPQLTPHVLERQASAMSRGEMAVPVSAKAEYVDIKHRTQSEALGAGTEAGDDREGLTKTKVGIVVRKEEADEVQARLESLKTTLHPGPVGVLQCLTIAVSMRPPIYVYPVSDLDTFAPIARRPGDTAASAVPCLEDCLLVKPGSTVGDVFTALKAGACSHARLTGEFVRCSAIHLPAESHQRQQKKKVVQLGRDSQLHASTILNIQTNRKSIWQ